VRVGSPRSVILPRSVFARRLGARVVGRWSGCVGSGVLGEITNLGALRGGLPSSVIVPSSERAVGLSGCGRGRPRSACGGPGGCGPLGFCGPLGARVLGEITNLGALRVGSPRSVISPRSAATRPLVASLRGRAAGRGHARGWACSRRRGCLHVFWWETSSLGRPALTVSPQR
jgi:hypothetical protein